MKLNRRQFMVIAAAISAGCNRSTEQQQAATAPTSKPTEATTRQSHAADAGPVSNFPPDTVSDAFRNDGFFVIHRDKKVFAISSVCTHKGCKVRLASDQSFYCKCHGSTFDREGHVTKSPAQQDLPRLAVRTDERQHLLVDPSQQTDGHG